MSGRKRPSGVGSNSRRFAEVDGPDGDTLSVPVAKDAGTFVFLATESGGWPRKPLTTLLTDASWIGEGSTLVLEEMRPGRGMGTSITVQVVEVRVVVAVHDGKYGQIKRMVLVDEVASREDVTREFEAEPRAGAPRD